MDEIIIHIFERSDGDYEYDFFDSEDGQAEDIESEVFEGGICTGTLEDTIDMASDELKKQILKLRVNGAL